MEMGALDGLKFSNTYAYEMLLGWRGVHIEASPQSYKVRTCVGVGVTMHRAATKLSCPPPRANNSPRIPRRLHSRVVLCASGFAAPGVQSPRSSERARRGV